MNLNIANTQDLITYTNIPGRTPSDKYVCKIRKINSNIWSDAFVIQTISKPRINYSDGTHNGYTSNLANWTASYVSFEFSGSPVEVEVAKVGGGAITKAMVRPQGHASAAQIVNGKAYVTFNSPNNINIDIDGQMEDQYTGMGYSGPPIHTISIFANPVFHKPSVSNPRVHQLEPGSTIPQNSTWDTLYFKPGIHFIGSPYIINSNKVLYIPGDAVVHGTIHPPDFWDHRAATNWSVYGSGTLSGEEVPRASGQSFNKPFTRQASNVTLDGFVVIDPAHHVFNMTNLSGEDTSKVNIYRNLKILGWRINGDGLNGFRNSRITNCFFRCQDDHFYYGANHVQISNCTSWSDYNGSVIYVTRGATNLESSFFKDIRVIYHRAGWHYWEGGRVISFRDRKPGNTIKNVNIKNVLIEDPFPAFPPFYFKMTNPENSNLPIDYENIIIENVNQPYPGVSSSQDNNFGKPRNTMLGLDNNRKFTNITFKNCSYNNLCIRNFQDGDFLINSFNDNIIFDVDCAITLPLDFLSFNGLVRVNDVLLSWKTTNEINSSHFDIERSNDGFTFDKVGRVQSATTNNRNINNYNFIDYPDFLNTTRRYYYRIKQIDTDQKFSYSNIIEVIFDKSEHQKLIVYPNPVGNFVTINCDQGYQILTFNGLIIKESSKETTSIDLSSLPIGMYILKTCNQIFKLIKSE